MRTLIALLLTTAAAASQPPPPELQIPYNPRLSACYIRVLSPQCQLQIQLEAERLNRLQLLDDIDLDARLRQDERDYNAMLYELFRRKP